MKDPDKASEQRRQMSAREALGVDINATMKEVAEAYRRGDVEEARRLIGRCCAAASIRLTLTN